MTTHHPHSGLSHQCFPSDLTPKGLLNTLVPSSARVSPLQCHSAAQGILPNPFPALTAGTCSCAHCKLLQQRVLQVWKTPAHWLQRQAAFACMDPLGEAVLKKPGRQGRRVSCCEGNVTSLTCRNSTWGSFFKTTEPPYSTEAEEV